MMGIALFATGDIEQGRDHSDRAFRFYDSAAHRSLGTRFGQDAGVSILSYRAYAQWVLGLSYLQKREYEKGIAHLEKAVASSGNSPRYVASLGYAFAVAGRKAEAERGLDKLRGLSKQRYVSPYYTATVYAGTGNAQGALEWLERAYQERDGWIPYIQSQPEFDGLRSDPGFQALVGRMNFPR